MHVFLDVRTLSRLPSASRSYLLALLDALFPALREGDCITVLRREEEVFPFRLINHPTIDYHVMKHSAHSRRGVRELNALVQKREPDVYWSADAYLRPPVAPRGKRLYLVFSVERLLTAPEATRSWWERLRWQRRVRSSLTMSDVLFCPSRAFAITLVADLGLQFRRRTVAIQNGVHPIFRQHTDDEILQARRRWLLPKRYILMVGASSERDAFVTPLRALANCDDVTSVPCVIIGDKLLPEVLRETIRDCHLEGMVRFLCEDEVSYSDISTIFSGAVVTFEPFQSLNYRPTVLRSLACGSPVICAANRSVEELYGNAVLRVHPTDASEWAKAFTALMLSSSLRERQIIRGLECVKTCTWTTTAKLSLHILRAVVEGRATKPLGKLLQ